MKMVKANALKPGVYRIYWKSGSEAVAVVGGHPRCSRWFCCSNWSEPILENMEARWRLVKKVELITVA